MMEDRRRLKAASPAAFHSPDRPDPEEMFEVATK